MMDIFAAVGGRIYRTMHATWAEFRICKPGWFYIRAYTAVQFYMTHKFPFNNIARMHIPRRI